MRSGPGLLSSMTRAARLYMKTGAGPAHRLHRRLVGLNQILSRMGKWSLREPVSTGSQAWTLSARRSEVSQ